MPDATLSQAIQEAYASAPADDVTLHTIELRHASFASPIRVVRDWDDLNATLEASAPQDASTEVLFVKYAFDLVLPDVTGDGTTQLVLEIDNISRDIVAAIELAMVSPTPIDLIYRAFLASDLSGPQNDPPLTLTIGPTIKVTPMRVRSTAGFADVVNKRFPSDDYDADRFPGLIAQ